MDFNESFLIGVIQVEDIRIGDSEVSMKMLHLKGEDQETLFTVFLSGVEFIQLEISDFARYSLLDCDDKQLVPHGELSKLSIMNFSFEFECHFKIARLEQLR